MGKNFSKTRLDLLKEILQTTRTTHIVDVGANPINENPYLDFLKSGHCKVWGFEPNPNAFDKLTSTDTETYLPYAIGDGKPGTLHLTQSAAMTSLYRPNAKTTKFFRRMGAQTRVEKEVPVETHALDQLDSVPEFDLLKIDVQGAEVQVFDGAKTKLSSAVTVISEVSFIPLYENQPLLDQQMATLRALGFDLHKFMSISAFSVRGGLARYLNKRRHSNQMLDGDAAFLRSLLTPESMSDEQIKHLAILCDAVVESYDLTIRCLDLLIARDAIDPGHIEDYILQLPNLAE